MRSSFRPFLIVLFGVLTAGASAQSAAPIAVALMTGFNPGSNPGMAMLDTKLQNAFAGGSPPFSSQVFVYTNQSGAASFLSAAGSNAKHVLIGHSFGASSNFSLAQNVLGPMGVTVDLQISVDWVSQTNPFSNTTPTVPPPIVAAYNYHQTSTNLFEPVPSSIILGALRNMNMEITFADTALVHTSVDCDARVHHLIIERIRELISPPPFPGTGEHLDLFGRVDTLNVACNPGAGIAVADVLSQYAVQTATTGQWITLRTVSTEGTFANAAFGILGELFLTGMTPIPALPGVASSLNPSALYLLTPGAVQTPPFLLAPLPAAGVDFTFCWPAGLTGMSVLVQTAVVTPASQNGIYATSLGIELRGM